MAKLNGKRFTELARVTFRTPQGSTGILVVRSDRKVLRRYTGAVGGTSYTTLGTLKADAEATTSTLRRMAERQGWTVTKEGK